MEQGIKCADVFMHAPRTAQRVMERFVDVSVEEVRVVPLAKMFV